MAPTKDVPKCKTPVATDKKPATKISNDAKSKPQAATTAPSSTKKGMSKTPLKVKSTRAAELRQKTNISKLTDKKSAPLPGSTVKTAKKAWQRRPKPAHSGVPMPERMKQLLKKHMENPDYSFSI